MGIPQAISEVSNWVKVLGVRGFQSWVVVRVLKGIGPFLLSQSAEVSKRWADHVLRMGEVEAAKVFLMEEVKMHQELKRTLLAKMPAAPPLERLQLSGLIEDIDRRLCRANVVGEALVCLPKPVATNSKEAQEPEFGGETESQAISQHWMDKFDDLARVHNEPWRQTLLARALAAEAAEPGAVSVRVLWLIGTLEKSAFESFTTLLSVAILVEGKLAIPAIRDPQDYLSRNVGDNLTVGNLCYRLGDSALISDPDGLSRKIAGKKTFQLSYGGRCYQLTSNTGVLKFSGLFLTALGNGLAEFCVREPHPTGEIIFDEWISHLSTSGFEVVEI